MILTDEDALICDFAEYYRIYDFRALPVKYAATLACGLEENSRIMRKLAGADYDLKTTLLISAVDILRLLWWAKTEDGAKNINRPVSLFEKNKINTNEETVAFETGEDLLKELQKRRGELQ